MTLKSLTSENAIRIPTLMLLMGLMMVIVFFVKVQTGVDAAQDTKIEERVRIPRYTTDQQMMHDWLKRVERKLDKVIEK